MDIDKSRIIYLGFFPNDSIRELYHKIFEISESKISEFENENNLKIQLLFNMANTQLSLYHCLPDNYQIREKCDLFLEKLNDFLEQNLEPPQIT